MNHRKSFTSGLALIAAGSLLLLCVTARGQQSASRIENAGALETLFRALAGAQSRSLDVPPVRILQYGDSHTAADIATSFLRRYFQRDFGIPTPRGGGVSLEIRAFNGAQAESLWQMSDPSFMRSLGAYQPQLVIIAYGTNEVTDGRWSFASYKRLYKGIISRFRAVSPSTPILVVGLPDRALSEPGGAWASPRKVETLNEAQRQAALESGAAFWSACGAMGGVGSMNTWVAYRLGQSDRAHLTTAGYARLSASLYTDFVLAFNGFWQTQGVKLLTPKVNVGGN